MKRKFLNVRVGVEFYAALMTQPCFQHCWKAISPSFYFIQWLASLNANNKGDAVEIYSGTIADIFKPYTKGAYAVYLSAMERLGILKNDHDFDYPGKKDGNLKAQDRGKCQKYLATEYGSALIHSANLEYLKKLRNDPLVRRNNRKSISKRKVMSKSYNNPVLDYIYDGLINIKYNAKDAELMYEKALWSNTQKASVSNILWRIEKKCFAEVKIGDGIDGRVHHELVQLKSDARFLLEYKGIPYKATLDIRCCHPTFLSTLILSKYNNLSDTTILHTPNTPTSLHLLLDKGDIYPNLVAEHNKWITFFCEPHQDPKDKITKICRFEDPDIAKMAMNESLNGSTVYPKYLRWMKKEFPLLYGLWQETDIKKTGVAISAQYERRLILREDLFLYATALGIEKVMPEHDGLGIFSNDDYEVLCKKLHLLAQYIKAASVKEFGVPVVLKIKPVFNWGNTDLPGEMTHKHAQVSKEFLELEHQILSCRKKYYANSKDRRIGERLGELYDRQYALLRRYKPVIDYLLAREKTTQPNALHTGS